MEADLSRLQVAIESKMEAINEDWRRRYRIAGFKVPDPLPKDDEELNDQVASTMELWASSFRRKEADH